MKTQASPARHIKNSFFEAYVFGKKDLANVKIDADDETRRRHEKDFLSEYFNTDPKNIFFLQQEHGDKIFHLNSNSADQNNNIYYGTGDAMFSENPDHILCIRTADCMPVFFGAKRDSRKLIGIIHAGWRGVKEEIIPKTLSMAGMTGYEISDFSILAGPCIGGESYQVKEDVARYFKIKTKNPDNSYMLDLLKNAALQIDKYQYTDKDFFDCTFSKNDIFYSHRKGDHERNLNVIIMRK